ncbi:MAG: NAD-dependent epimerase/dehydratase family protein [Longimicrobiales bacterium]
MTTRREFLALGGAAALAAAGPGRLFARPAPHPLRILILGGTSFLGPHQVAYALGRGHSVSTFTRGRTDPTVHAGVFREVEPLIGDRAHDLEALRGRQWDAVIDNSGREVEWTRDSAVLLADQARTYLYTSSTGVHYPYLGGGITEESPVSIDWPPDVASGEDGALDYAVMKARSERAAREAFGADRTIVVRPGYMVGPGDRTDRFAYWPVRLARGGRVLVPGRADDPVQWIDVRDVAEWMIRLVEREAAGTYNAVGPASETGMHRFVHGAQAAFSAPTDFVAVDDHEFLAQHGVRYVVPWIMPTGNNFGSARIRPDRAVEHGLAYRPLADTVRDFHEWWQSDAVPAERREGLVSGPRSLMAREAEILEAWADRG